MQLKNAVGTIRLRWRALDIDEWRAIPNEKRDKFLDSKGKRNPPVRGADIPGRYFLDFYNGGSRGTKNINLRTSYDARANDENERLARQVALNYGDMEWRERHRFETKSKAQVPFVEFFRTLVDGRHWAWRGALRLLETFPLKETAIGDIDYDWLSEIQKHLLNAPTRSRRTLSQNSASTYYAKVKAALQIAVQRGLIATNPTTKIRAIQQVPSQRVYLTIDELQLLANTPCEDAEVSRAFFFSCYTGLRISDIIALKGKHYQNHQLATRMQKTDEPIWLDLPPIAERLLGDARGVEEPLFNLPPDGTTWTMLQVWAAKAGLKKHISMHVGRHTFATLMLGQTKDIYLVSKLLGHTDIKPTQLYAKIVDDRKKSAMLSMPEIELPSIIEKDGVL